MTSLDLNEKDEEPHADLLAVSHASVDKNENTIQVNSNAAGAGSAVSKGRLYSADYSPETGEYEIAVEYERNYDVEFVAGVQISIFTRTEYGE